MILVRQVFQAKYGRGDELVALFKESREMVPAMANMRLLTDASGPFFTVVTEYEVPSLGEWEQGFREAMAHPRMGEWFGRMVPLVESGSREFYNVVE
jgi:hypothetical protein